MPYYTDSPDTILASLTGEGRNLLARSKLGIIIYEKLGWNLGLGGYEYTNPVKITPFVDNAAEAIGYIQVLNNTFDAGDQIVLNGKSFIYETHWIAGSTIAKTVENIRDAVLNSTDLAHYNLVMPYIDPLFPDTLEIQSLVTGEIGNHFIIEALEAGWTTNFDVTPLSGGISIDLENPAYPVPPTLGTFYLPEGRIETIPLDYFCNVTQTWYTCNNTISFVMRLPEGTVGLGAYGELGIWAEVKESTHPDEIGRRVLFAHAHFPIQPKSDRHLLTFRVIIQY